MSRALITRTAAVLWLVVGCAAPPPESETVNDTIVITKYAPGVDFKGFGTFYVRPDVYEYNEQGDPEPIDADVAKPLVDATRSNLEARGYTEAATPMDADLGVQLLYADHINTSYWCYYWWDPYYWGYPVWGYYPYYGGCDTTMWKSNTLSTVMVDLTDAKNEGAPIGGEAGAGGVGGGGLTQLPGVWASAVYGISISSKEARDGINQAFKQSPYLRAQ